MLSKRFSEKKLSVSIIREIVNFDLEAASKMVLIEKEVDLPFSCSCRTDLIQSYGLLS